MTTLGTRHASDAGGEWGPCVVGSVNLLNERLNPRGEFFYFDEADVAASGIGGFKVYDMYGWVVGSEERAEFEPLWLADVDRHAASDGSCPLGRFCDVTVTREDRDGAPHARITHFDSFDEEAEVIPYD